MQAQQGSIPVTIDAPVDGWNAFDSLDNMPKTAAVVLNNLIPEPGRVVSRLGQILYEDLGTGAPVETVASFSSATASKLVAASSGGIFVLGDSAIEASAQSTTEAAPVGTFNSDRWQTENFRKADETGIMAMCNGVDTTQIFDGVNVTDISTSGTDEALVFTPNFIGCLTFKGRMYYWLDDDNAFYYTQAGSYQGVFQKYDLGTFTRRGGKLTLITTWTQQDSGDGKDDFIVFVFDTGEVLIYQGDDPETTGYFEMVGRYLTSEPLSIRGTTQYGADTIIMTRDGYVALSTIIQEGRTSDVHQFSRLIHNAITERTQVTRPLYGWDVELFPRQGLMIFNVPISDDVFEQHVLNTVTQKWTRFKGISTACMCVHDERLFGGTRDGKIVAMLESTADFGRPILYDCLMAFDYHEAPGTQKHLVAAQIISTMSNPANIQITGYADFDVPDLIPITLPVEQIPSTWSVDPADPPSVVGSFWDEDFWSVEGVPYTTKGWQNVSAYGYAVSILVRFYSVNEQVIWRSTGLRLYMGGAQ